MMQWSSNFIWFSKWYAKQFGDLKDKIKCITLTRVICLFRTIEIEVIQTKM